MDLDLLRQDVARGTTGFDQLVELIASQQKIITRQQTQIEQLQAEIEELKTRVGKHPTDRRDEAYSEKAEEERQAKAGKRPRLKKKPKRQGRITTAEKIA